MTDHSEQIATNLVGDMPWVTEHLTDAQIDDLKKQIAACFRHNAARTLAAHEATIKELQTIRDWVATDHRFPYLQLPPRVIKALDAAKGEPLRNPVHESLAGGDA